MTRGTRDQKDARQPIFLAEIADTFWPKAAPMRPFHIVFRGGFDNLSAAVDCEDHIETAGSCSLMYAG